MFEVDQAFKRPWLHTEDPEDQDTESDEEYQVDPVDELHALVDEVHAVLEDIRDLIRNKSQLLAGPPINQTSFSGKEDSTMFTQSLSHRLKKT